ncbi:MAG: calcium/sodium antiporter [Bacteroidales bacterium]|nr:calcium/sodium antiporter [Bacteroidales bacterium]
MPIVYLIIGFAILIYGADKLVDGASSLARRLNVPDIIIGLTIVAFGTSAPELVVNVFAAVNHSTEIVTGNIIGSNIFNVAVILGLSAIIYPLNIKTNTTWIEIPLSLLAGIVAFLCISDILLDNASSGYFSRVEGILCLGFFVIFLGYTIHTSLAGQASEEVQVKELSKLKTGLFILIGMVLLIVGGKLIVNNAIIIANWIGMSERVIGLTVVSIGTSLPELATSLVAARKKNADIAVGNVVGSNIFNIFLILGISSVITPFHPPQAVQLDMLYNIGLGLFLFIFVFTGKGRKIERWEGILFLLSYMVYIYFIISRT